MIEFAPICCGKLELFWHGPYVLYADDVLALPADVPGVYVLSAFTPLYPTLVPFYVGQTNQLRRRLAEHLVGGRTFAVHLRDRLSTYFCVANVSDQILRTAAEAALIRCLQPAGNDNVPTATPVAVNPPPLSLLET